MALERAGIEAIVYEASNAPADYVGLFLNTSSNGLDVLRAPWTSMPLGGRTASRSHAV
jgi:hypothetical protein